MLETLTTRCVTPKSVEWVSPTKLKMDIGDGEDMQLFPMLKGAIDYLHNKVELKVATSKELFKKSEEMWRQLRDTQLEVASDKMKESSAFYLDKPTLIYIIDDNKCVVDIIDFPSMTDYEDFKLKHERHQLDLTARNRTKNVLENEDVITSRIFNTSNREEVIKFICYDKNVDILEEEYTPVVIAEYNNKKAKYQVYNGILICNKSDEEGKIKYTLMPSLSPLLNEKSYSSLIEYFDMEKSLDYAKDKAEELYNAYVEFENDPIEISAREMTSLCKLLGYKLELDDGDTLHPFENMSDEDNNIRIQKFYNTFKNVTGESTYEILQMSDLKRTFRFNKMTLLEMLSILSQEYINATDSKVSASILSDIVYKLFYNKGVDKIQSEDVKHDIK